MKEVLSQEQRLTALEQKLAQSLEKISALELALAKERAITQIQNCMGRYAYMHTGGKHTECMECFAVGDSDLSIEIGPMGVFKGPDAAYRVYHIIHNAGEGDRVGFCAEHTLTTPVIEVADDLQTAKAIWISPGHETSIEPDGSADPTWMWGRYAMDFKCVDGQWKIWHFQMFPTFRCNYYTAWTDTVPFDRLMRQHMAERPAGEEPPAGPGGLRPDAPMTFFEEYATDRVMRYWPQPPAPYQTFEGTQSMVGAPPEGV